MRAHFGIYIHIYRIYIQTHTLYQTTKKSKSNFAYFPQLCKFGLKLCKILFCKLPSAAGFQYLERLGTNLY